MLIKKTAEFIHENNFFKNDDSLIVGFSGGPDSVFLLQVLLKYKELFAPNIKINLCHINHLLRGEDSDSDEKFCIDMKNKFKDVNVFSKRFDIEVISKELNISFEEAGRKVRYDFFNEVSKEVGGTKIVLAHNLDDQVETFLFRLIRGTSLIGLEGMSLQKENLIRPLLNIYKKDILKYLDDNKIKYCIDKSNFENDYTRNSIRNELIPFIENKYNLKFKDKVAQVQEEIRENNDFFNYINLNDFISANRLVIAELKKTSKFIQKKVLHLYLIKNNLKSDRYKITSMIELLDVGGTKKLSLGENIYLVKDYEYIYIENENSTCNFIIETLQEDNSSSYTDKKNIFKTNLPQDSKFEVRTRREGDKIFVDGHQKKVKDIMINEKIPLSERDFIPIVTFNEEIVWIGGVRGSDKFKKSSTDNKNERGYLTLKIRRL